MKKASCVYFGGDYNPDQWDDETIDEDMKLFRKAGINILTLPVFSWAKLEPREGEYDFGWLDRILDKIAENGIRVCLATPTTAQPAWMSLKYPEILPVDIAGRKRTHGMRVSFCVNSQKYRERAAAIAEQMAKRYCNHPAVAMWHVANEYGTYCYCENCQKKFREWLKKKYGSIEELNSRWNTAFWDRTYYSFDEIVLPSELNDDYLYHQAEQLDYMRFVTDSTAECFDNEYKIIKKYSPDLPVLTNISGFIKKLDQFEMVKHMDYAGWDNYPAPYDPGSKVALKLDIMRGLKGGQSFMLMEQSPNQQNWQPYNKLKRPGEVRMLSYQAIAHGADTCMFFQMRQSVAGQEKFHGAVISHSGRDDTRVYKEISQLGSELKKAGDTFIGARTTAKVGILFDWNNWWALELSSGPSKDMDYFHMVEKYYRPFYDRNIAVDILPVDADLSSYKVILAPMLYMIKEGVAEKLQTFVRNGGTFIATTMSGLTDENDRCIFGEYPGKLKDLLGIWVEETDALYPDERNQIVVQKQGEEFGLSKAEYNCSFLCDLIHTQTAQSLAVYGKDFYKGVTCLTKNNYGKGLGYYLGTESDDAFMDDFISNICIKADIKPVLCSDSGVEITERENQNGKTIFIINHNKKESKVELGDGNMQDLLTGDMEKGTITIKAGDVKILLKKKMLM